ncbi:MAG: glycosyltransferase family 2 protein [Dysgonamonadaceae bacterium]
MNLSVGIITYNEANDLPRTLQAVKDIADEIVIVDSGSTDETPEIASSFGARFYVEEWKGFGMQKNSVIEKCKGKWILLIDADEEISPALREEIRQITVQEQTPFNVYKLRFLTFCFGKGIKHGGWSGFFRVRLFRNGSGKYNDNRVHENFITTEAIGAIHKNINHYTYIDLGDYLQKFNHYTSQSAEMYYQRGKKKSFPMIILSAGFYFLKSYIWNLGFLDGYEGYLLSKLGALVVLIKYSKLRELNQRSVNRK